MACWVFLILFFPALHFAGRCATDFAVEPPRYWQRPASYGKAVLFACLIWSAGWFAPVLWRHRTAFDRPDLSEARILRHDLYPYLPAGIGILLAGIGLYLIASAFTRRGQNPHCRHCGYERAGPGRVLTPICPECGRRWSWFGDAAIGARYFSAARAAWGALLAGIGCCGVALQIYF